MRSSDVLSLVAAAGQIAGNLAGNVPPHVSYLRTVSKDRWRVKRRTSRRSRPASRADVAALCLRPCGRTSRGKPTVLPNPRTIRRTDSPESRTSGDGFGPSRRWKSGPGSLPRASVHSTRAAAVGSGRVIRSFSVRPFPRIQIAVGRPDPGAPWVPPGPASTSARSRLHSSTRRNPDDRHYSAFSLWGQ